MTAFSPKKPDTKLITVRILPEQLEVVDKNAAKVKISRNEFIIQSISFALEHLEIPE